MPFFLPLQGCPGQCIFCDQHAQTGQGVRDLETALGALQALLESVSAPCELGFFGGTFTGLSREWQRRFLVVANSFRHSARVTAVRISTRPDRVDAHSLQWLREQGVGLVELGVQSFASAVLSRSGRGYSGQVASEACVQVLAAGLKLGIQLLPGLPEHGPAQWREDVLHALDMRPEVVRIYPCVVLSGTELARWYANGVFTPWSLDLAVSETAWAVRQFWEHGIRVIRLGLAGEPLMLERLVAGPWHPSFGNMVRSRVLRDVLTEPLAAHEYVRHVYVPARLNGDLWGYRGESKKFLAQWGIAPHTVSMTHDDQITIELEKPHAAYTCY